MKRISLMMMALALAGVAAAFAAEEAKPAIQPTEKIELFNGKDLSNFSIYLKDEKADPAKTFTVADGLIKCTGEPWGYIRSKDAYQNYVLTVEWRYTKAVNTGVFVHASGPDKIWPKALECQGQHGGQGNFVAFDDVKFDGMKGRSTPRKGEDPEKPVGEWNVYKIVCDGNNVQFFVNGKLMNEAKNLNVSSGNICLQSEGGVLECRKMTLEPIQKDAAGKKGKGKGKGKGKRKAKKE